MTEISTAGAPRKILLATDLSARCDRALERAAALASAPGAQLCIVYVVENPETSAAEVAQGAASWRQPEGPALMRRRIREALAFDGNPVVEAATLLIEQGQPAEVIERIATEQQVDLIVTGIARESPFTARPVMLGKTVEQLLRRLPAPILIVRNRTRGAYSRIVVATDLSEPSGHALQMALRFFPGQPLDLLHATDMPVAGLAADSEQPLETFRESRQKALGEFLDSIFVPAEDRARLNPLIGPGAPQQIVRDHVQDTGADLVVLGTRGRGAVMEALLGSTAKSILSTLPSDALVVRGPR